MNILDLPIEILTIIATTDFRTFKAAILAPGIGLRLLSEYSQNYAKDKFISVEVEIDGSIRHYCDNMLHRIDGPAMVYGDGAQCYYKNGQLHRNGGPAVIIASGEQHYYKNGVRHRDDGPAVIYPSGEQYYYKNGLFHREDGPALIWPNGTQEYYKNGKKVEHF